MTRTKLEKIANLEKKIKILENQRKQEMEKYKKEERKTRTKRFCSRHGLFESIIPETINLTNEQFKIFLERTVANEFGKKALAKIVSTNDTPFADIQGNISIQKNEVIIKR